MLTPVFDTVVHEIRALLAEIGPAPDGLGTDDRLDGIGLDSLRLARLMIALESKLGVDPFSEDAVDAESGEPADIFDMHTVGDLAAAYAGALDRQGAVETTRSA